MVSVQTFPNLLPRKEKIKIEPGSRSKLRADDQMNYALVEDHLPRSQIIRLNEISMDSLQLNQSLPTFHIKMHTENDESNIQRYKIFTGVESQEEHTNSK